MSFPGSDADASTSASGDEEEGNTKESVAPGGSVFAVLQAYASHVFAPIVRAYAASRGGDEKVRRFGDRTRVLYKCLEIALGAASVDPVLSLYVDYCYCTYNWREFAAA